MSRMYNRDSLETIVARNAEQSASWDHTDAVVRLNMAVRGTIEFSAATRAVAKTQAVLNDARHVVEIAEAADRRDARRCRDQILAGFDARDDDDDSDDE